MFYIKTANSEGIEAIQLKKLKGVMKYVICHIRIAWLKLTLVLLLKWHPCSFIFFDLHN